MLEKLNFKKNGLIPKYLEDLILSGFISRDFTWHIKNETISKLSHYRLKDNYSIFYLKYILPNRNKILLGNMKLIALSNLKGWYGVMGLQIENLVLRNRDLIKTALKINPNDVVCDNPFYQRKNTKQAGCQVDYLIQTKHNTLYMCEIKFSSREIGIDVIDEVEEKIKRMKIPKGFSCRTVLIHVNCISESLEDRQYFSHVIDFGAFLQKG